MNDKSQDDLSSERKELIRVTAQLPLAKGCDCESRAAQDEAICHTAKTEIADGTVPR